MAALTAARNTAKIDDPVIPRTMALPVSSATTIYAGSLVGTNALGYAVPMTGLSTLKCWGRAKSTIINAGASGAMTVELDRGAFPWNIGTSADALTIADRGNVVYAIDDNTVGRTDNTGARSVAGILLDIVGTQAIVLVGFGSVLPSGNSAQQNGTVTLASGTATVSTGITLTASSRIFFSRKTQGGTVSTTVHYEAPSANRVVGGPGVANFTALATVAAGTIQNTDNSVLDYLIVG